MKRADDIAFWKSVFAAGLHPEIRKIGQDQFNEQVLDLLRSDQELTPEVRDYIADELERYYFPERLPERSNVESEHRDQLIQYRVVRSLKATLMRCGLTAQEADQEIANELGISVDALHKRMQRLKDRGVDRDAKL